MESKYSDEAIQENARNKFRELLFRQPAIERLRPVAQELGWVLGGCVDASQHEKILPEYCYNILDLQRRTIFKAFPTMAETMVCPDKTLLVGKTIAKAKQFLSIDWDKLGR